MTTNMAALHADVRNRAYRKFVKVADLQFEVVSWSHAGTGQPVMASLIDAESGEGATDPDTPPPAPGTSDFHPKMGRQLRPHPCQLVEGTYSGCVEFRGDVRRLSRTVLRVREIAFDGLAGATLLSSIDSWRSSGGGMARPRWTSIGISVAVIAAIGVSGWFVVIRHNALAPLLCFAPPDQAAMIDMFEDDPLYSVAPEDGRLREEKATNYECDNGHGGSPLNPLFATVTRFYATPAVYSVAQLHERFTQAAAAAGWLNYREKGDGSYVYVGYCKPFGDRVADAWIQSRRGLLGAEVEVTLDARVDGSTCSKP